VFYVSSLSADITGTTRLKNRIFHNLKLNEPFTHKTNYKRISDTISYLHQNSSETNRSIESDIYYAIFPKINKVILNTNPANPVFQYFDIFTNELNNYELSLPDEIKETKVNDYLKKIFSSRLKLQNIVHPHFADWEKYKKTVNFITHANDPVQTLAKALLVLKSNIHYRVHDDRFSPFHIFMNQYHDCNDAAVLYYSCLRTIGLSPNNIRIIFSSNVYAKNKGHAFLLFKHGFRRYGIDNDIFIKDSTFERIIKRMLPKDSFRKNSTRKYFIVNPEYWLYKTSSWRIKSDMSYNELITWLQSL